ncbi:uncharacterized protein BCR38DRAFT_193063 [Pseudomassariella vexata]|uniref:Uncharacterized protein n=1 Tax=Pseudomassariella vexata TaxID=1141098 RepID=A0A1Y2E0Y7_9PEZI|nr:uncharacterized protein BCR38DRAFT_193063 [Pseudomassariella vexata]ORY65202.1 hypothetical protein BCR38DRAFT_193063 [Pseudomassariella vexata]
MLWICTYFCPEATMLNSIFPGAKASRVPGERDFKLTFIASEDWLWIERTNAQEEGRKSFLGCKSRPTCRGALLLGWDDLLRSCPYYRGQGALRVVCRIQLSTRTMYDVESGHFCMAKRVPSCWTPSTQLGAITMRLNYERNSSNLYSGPQKIELFSAH